MAISPAKRFQRLDALLSRLGAGDGCMRLSELDGFIAGIAVCPELVRPTEWLPLIWGRAGPGFQSDREAQEVVDLIMGRYNEVLQSLAEPGKYQPILNEERAGVVIWELWASGFHKAVRLRPRSWEAFTESSDRDVRRAISGLLRIAEIAAGDATASVDLDRLLHENAAEFIGASVGALHQARIARQVGLRDPAQTPAMSVGRNDPCPCGSGKKFKHCCLN